MEQWNRLLAERNELQAALTGIMDASTSIDLNGISHGQAMYQLGLIYATARDALTKALGSTMDRAALEKVQP